MPVKDSNGSVLSATNYSLSHLWERVGVANDLKVRGASIPLKRGSVIKNIRMIDDDEEHIEGHSDKIKGGWC